MTDNRRQLPPHDDPPARPPTRTDALPTRDADALDTWLDARAGSLREGAAAAPAIPPTGQNGQWSTAIADASTSAGSDVSNRAASLTGVASQFHTRFAAAEEAEAPPAPVDTIWEQIMARSLAAHVATPATPPQAVPQDADRPAVARHPVFARMASHPAATMLLVAAAMIAMVLVFRAIDRNTHPQIIDYGPAAMVGDGTATPSASAVQLSTPDANGCIVRTLSAADEAAIANPAAMPTPNYTVSGPLNNEAIAHNGWAAWKSSIGCGISQPTLADNQEAGALSLYLLATVRQGEASQTRIPLNEQRLQAERDLSATLVEQDPTRYTIDANDPAVTPWLITNASGLQSVILPQDFTTFADGRIGAPIKLARPGGAGTATKDSYMSPQTVPYVFFRQEDGVWLVDEQLALCTWKCDDWFAARQRDIDADRAANGLSTPRPSIDSPIATQSPSIVSGGDNLRPATTTTASATADIWLQPITNAECDNPITAAGNEHEQAALSLRAAYACSDVGTKSRDASQSYSDGFLQRHPEMQRNQYTLADDIARAEAISTVIANAHPMITVMGLPGADDQSTRTEGFYEVFLPDRNTIQLDDGRFAIPLTIAFTDEDRATRAATAVAPGGDTPYTVAVYVFTMQDGSPRVDDLLLACIANCDGFWQQQRSMIGTPQAGTDLATPAISPTATADPDAKLPVPSSECIVPTVVANQEALPTRSYMPPLKPTDANAAAVNQAARAFIACIEAAPSADNVQDVIAPFETERLRNEIEANADQPPTTEQIEAGKHVSAYLEEQGVKTFAEHAPADAVDPIQAPTPRSVGGWTVTPAGFYSVPMPGVTIQFPDGRIGIPTLVMVTTDDLWADLQNRAYTSGSLGIFAKVGDTWLLDETLGLCIGECDAFWQDAATPSGDSQWMQPVTASECVPVSASTYREYVRPRDYTIVNTAARPDVAQQGRALAACSPDGGEGLHTAIDSQFETARKQETARTGAPLSAEQITAAQELSASYEADGYQVFQRAPQDVDVTNLPFTIGLVTKEGTITYTTIYLPDEAITFTDGRVAIPSTLLVSDDESWAIAQQQPYQETPLTIWAQVGGIWLIDETLPLCIGDCDAFWQQIAAREGTTIAPTVPFSPTPATTATPVAAIDQRRFTTYTI
jgi:hypothetical protein